MLITKLKEREEILSVLNSKNVFIFKCFGCKEVYLPEGEIDLLLTELKCMERMARVDYLCREEFTVKYLGKYADVLKKADKIVVFSCGVGVQVVAKCIPETPVIPGCDTHYINGFQGLTTQDVDCEMCGQCWLNLTGGICPITSCSKSLLNGPCGGANKDGKCEVNKDMDCGWVLIYKRLKLLGEEEILKRHSVNIRDYKLIINGDKKE
ncbi:MAG: methylenetetrahydrofolate reductase C-terminal domain-containing protein [Candidatus Omnitrophica bacterium]|nr:methylenetetrahydrofolate reductase C-terminal domain-containing protein [Candidatus Omnitrophota bacterium]MCM8777138.1 methylenetetrahydrofolate reductase C-terminal domain-containing protein [Candidatus Omnitrophota bacterium]